LTSKIDTTAISGTSMEKESAPSLLRRLRARLRGRPDTEHEMTPNRMIFAGSVVLFLLFAAGFGIAQARAMLLATYMAFIVYFCVAFAIFAHIVWRPGISVARRLVAMAADFSMISFAAAAGGIATGFFYPFYLWTIFGNGFRFGIPFLYAAMLFGNIGFLGVLAATGIWRDHLGLSIALSLSLLMLPLYAGKLIKKISEAKDQAEEANRAKSAFLASISHELRTPLNAIIGLGDLLRGQMRDVEQEHMVQTISRAGRTLLNLITTILDFSRLEAGRMPSTPADVDFFGEMSRIETMLAVSAGAKSLAFNVHISGRSPRRIHADFSHIEQVLVNLSANAIKFTAGGHVVIAADAVGQDGERVRLRFEVTDTGIGIAPEAQERIFETFAQADSTILDRYGGTGLGLAICKQLVKLLNGEIGLDSEPGKGSTFWFEVDVRALPEGEDEDEPLPADQPLVLLTRDNELKQLVRTFGGDLLETERAAEVLDVADRVGDGATAPIVIADQRELDQTEEVAAVRAMRDTAVLIAVAETAGLGPIDVALRRDYATSIARPLVHRDLRHALRIADLKSGRAAEDTAPAAITTPVKRPLSILVAEDNRTNQMVIAKILERVGHRATLVDNGQEALDALLDTDFDIVLMDVNMPIMNGIEATKLHRFASLGGRRVPIVALTADASSDAWMRCEEAGMDAYATKPIEPARLLAVIERVASAPTERIGKVVSLAEHSPAAKAVGRLVDTSKLEDLERLGGCDFVADIVSQFSLDSAQLLRLLSSATHRNDVQAFREAAHALRSSAANVGAMYVFETCLALRATTPEQLALEGEKLILQLEQEIKRSVALLEACAANSARSEEKIRALTGH
jgi:two-component system sensor histidine kinase RpfC